MASAIGYIINWHTDNYNRRHFQHTINNDGKFTVKDQTQTHVSMLHPLSNFPPEFRTNGHLKTSKPLQPIAVLEEVESKLKTLKQSTNNKKGIWQYLTETK